MPNRTTGMNNITTAMNNMNINGADLPTRAAFLETSLKPLDNVPSDLTCPICRSSSADMVDPVRLPCHVTHIFCKECITNWLQTPNVNGCPSCRTTLFNTARDDFINVAAEEGFTFQEEHDGNMIFRHENGVLVMINVRTGMIGMSFSMRA